MKQIWNTVQIGFSAFGGFLGWFLGGADGFLYALIAFAVTDYLKRLTCDLADRNLSSELGINNPNPKAALDVTGEIYMNGFSVMGLQQAAIADDVSLNELTSPGIYFRRSVPQENLNYPALVFGMLEVFSCSVNLVIQRYTARDSPFDTYIRSRVNSSWSAWVKK